MSIKERRIMERFVLQLPAWISIAGDCGNPEQIQLTTSNICAGGAYLQAVKPLPVGTDIRIVLHLPLDNIFVEKGKRSQIKLNGKVVRTEMEGMAVLFSGRYHISPII